MSQHTIINDNLVAAAAIIPTVHGWLYVHISESEPHAIPIVVWLEKHFAIQVPDKEKPSIFY